MLIEIIIYLLGEILVVLGSFLPGNGQVPLLLPWGIDAIFVSGVQGYKILSTSFPPFSVVLNAFVIYLGFKIVLQLLKAIPILGKTIK